MLRDLTQLSRFVQMNPTLIQKALTSATNVGEALIPQNLEQIITDTVIRLSPELALITPKDTGGAKTGEYNQVTVKPAPGGAMGESSITPVTNSQTVRQTIPLKIIKRKGQISGFLQDASRKYIDTQAFEMQNQLQAHVFDMIHYLLYGNAVGCPYEFSGLDYFISTNRSNQVLGGAVPTTLAFLDDMIDQSNRKGGSSHLRVFGMSPEMVSLVSRLLTNVRLNQGLVGSMSQVNINGGWRLNAYRDIPIIETTATSPSDTMRPTISFGQSTTTGSLSDGVHWIRVAPVTVDGEQLASAGQSITLNGGGSTEIITIQLSDIHKDAAGNPTALKYKIYGAKNATTGTEKLLSVVPAFVYDASGTPSAVTTAFNGDGSNKITIKSMTADTSVTTAMQSDLPLQATGSINPEIIYLWDMDPIQGLGKFLFTNSAGSSFNGLVTTEPLAKTEDFYQFLIKTYGALTPSFEATSVWARGYRRA